MKRSWGFLNCVDEFSKAHVSSVSSSSFHSKKKFHKWLDKETTLKKKSEGYRRVLVKIMGQSSWFYKTWKNVNKREQT